MALVHFTKGELEPFYIEAERAVALNPNDTAVLGFAAHFMGPTGKWDRALALMDKAIRLNPAHPPWYHWVFMFDHYRRGEYEMALDRALRTGPLAENVLTYINRAAIYGQLGRSNDARAVLDQLRELRPGFTLRDAADEWGVKRNFEPSLLANLLDGLRKAGLDIPDEPTAAD